ncbi:MAG: DMT family transporter [Nitrososphaerales archaeon]
MVGARQNLGNQRASRERKGYILGMVLTLGSAALWGSTYAVIKIDLLYYTAYDISMFRAVFGSASLLVYLAVARKRLWVLPRDPKILVLLVCASFLGATGFWTLLNLGVLFVDPDTASFLVALYPLISIVFAAAFLEEKLTFAKAGGVMLGILGTFIIVAFGEETRFAGADPVIGEIFSLLAAFSWAGYMVVTKVLMGRKDKKTGLLLDAEYVTFTTFLIAIIPTMLITASTGTLSDLLKTPITGLVLNLYLGGFTSALAFVIFNIGMRLIGVSRAAVNQLLFPGVAILISYVLLGEIVNLIEAAGIALIVLGILMAQLLSKG